MTLHRAAAVITIATPPVLTALAAGIAIHRGGVSAGVIPVTAAFYALTVLGLTVGFHRLFSHRSFRASAWVKYLFGALGSMAAQGPLLFWAVEHRKHHQATDRDGDPHSPRDGFLHAHMTWSAHTQADLSEWGRVGRDLVGDRPAFSVSRYYPLWVFVGIAAPALITFLINRTPISALEGALWGGFARIFIVHHVTWSVNSICHLFGSRTYPTGDDSTNNWIVALFSFGEGWHNNHHAFPYSARGGLKPLEIDFAWWTILLLKWTGAVRDIKLPRENAFPIK